MNSKFRLRIFILSLLLTLPCLPTWSSNGLRHNRLLSFEEGLPAFINANKSTIETSGLHFKDGKQSLKWKYDAKSELNISRDMFYEKKTQNDAFLSTFSAWVYNDKASNNIIEFVFSKDGKKACSFSYGINFTGWRAIYVSYERDMQGEPVEGMNQLTVIAPEYDGGELFFDMILTGSKVDPRHHTPDIQQPFVNKGVTNHWQTMLYQSANEPDVDLYMSEVSANELQAVAMMEQRLHELIFNPDEVTDKKIDNLEKKFSKYNIITKNGVVSGLPLFYVYNAEAFERLLPDWSPKLYAQQGQDYKEYFNLMHQIANSYANVKNEAQKKRLEIIYIAMYDHAKNQGIAYGSGLGNTSHYGYSFRGFFSSFFLMKDVLQRNNRLKDAYAALQWYAQINEVFVRPKVNGQNMDAFNTLSMAKICSILMMENSPEKLQYIRAYSRWIDTGCMPSPGTTGAFKVDGSAYHHVGHYPAYAIGGLDGATKMIYIFHGTPFAISEYGHETVKNVLLAMRFYCNTTNFPLALSGRHPNGKGQLVPIQFARMAASGTPDGKEPIDREMASAFLRLVDTTTKQEDVEFMPKTNKHEQNDMINLFKLKGITPEKNPEGNLAMGYACSSTQRRKNWAAVVKGHSRYLWASEHYGDANFYGRYLAYASLQIMTDKVGGWVTPQTGGWIQEGFNWARIPGTTTINLPLDKLQAPKKKSEMLISDEAFAGGISQKNYNGAFGMKLHEHDRYNGSHRARKSYHFFDNRIICLGSNIENTINEHNTETTIFQLAVSEKEDKQYWESHNSDMLYWRDHIGTSYYIPKNKSKQLVFEKNYPQQSKYQNNGKSNVGNWVNLVINHGKAPKVEEYEYVVMPQTSLEEAKRVSSSYKVIQKDKNAHIVKDLASNTTSFVFFETPLTLPNGIIQSVDTASLVMLQEDKNNILLTVANPDLAFYRGESQEKYNKNGKREVLNVYSRPWNTNESKPVPVVVTLKGRWYATSNDGYIQLDVEGQQTIIKFMCQHGKSINIKLSK